MGEKYTKLQLKTAPKNVQVYVCSINFVYLIVIILIKQNSADLKNSIFFGGFGYFCLIIAT